jgi:hypothetical protein
VRSTQWTTAVRSTQWTTVVRSTQWSNLVRPVGDARSRISIDPGEVYRSDMVALIRAVQIALLLMLSAIAISLVVGLFHPETGALEKVVLAAMFAGCFALAVGITSAATRLQRRLVHR